MAAVDKLGGSMEDLAHIASRPSRATLCIGARAPCAGGTVDGLTQRTPPCDPESLLGYYACAVIWRAAHREYNSAGM